MTTKISSFLTNAFATKRNYSITLVVLSLVSMGYVYAFSEILGPIQNLSEVFNPILFIIILSFFTWPFFGLAIILFSKKVHTILKTLCALCVSGLILDKTYADLSWPWYVFPCLYVFNYSICTNFLFTKHLFQLSIVNRKNAVIGATVIYIGFWTLIIITVMSGALAV